MGSSAIFIALAVAAAAAPVSAATPPHPDGEAELQALLAGRVAGKPVSCLSLPLLGSSQVIEGTAIVYQSGGRLYVNRPDGAESLNGDQILVTRTSGSQLCRTDAVDLHDRSGMFFAGFVVLGDFVPYERVKTTR